MRSTKLLFWFNKLFICSTKLYYILSQVTFWLCVQVTNSKNLSLHFPNTGDHQFWQGGNLPVEEPTYLVRWPFDHVVTWQMNKFYVWTYTVPRATKLDRVVTCDGKTQLQCHVTFWFCGHVTNEKKSYIWTFTIPMAAKLCRVVTYG